MIPELIVPDHVPEAKHETYREFLLTQLLQGELVKYGVTQRQATTICAYLLFKAFTQFEHPNVMCASAQGLLQDTMERIEAFAQFISQRADIAVKLSHTDRVSHQMWEASIGKAKLAVNIDESDFSITQPKLIVPS